MDINVTLWHALKYLKLFLFMRLNFLQGNIKYNQSIVCLHAYRHVQYVSSCLCKTLFPQYQYPHVITALYIYLGLYSIPCKTAALVLEFAVEDLPLAGLQSIF